MPKKEQNWVYHNRTFTPTNEDVDGENISTNEIGLSEDIRYLFDKDWNTGVFRLREGIADEVATIRKPYTLLINGKFFKKNGSIFYVGGFSIL